MTRPDEPDRPTPEVSDTDLRTLWQDPEHDMIDTNTLDLDTLRTQAERLDRAVRQRNLVELAAVVVVVLMCGFMTVDLVKADAPLIAAGNVLLGLGALVVGGWILLRGRAPQADPAADTTAFLAQYRAELDWQIDLLRAVPRWYLAPFAPGILLIGVGAAVTAPTVGAGLLIGGITLGAAGGLAVGITALNRKAARALEAERDAQGRV